MSTFIPDSRVVVIAFQIAFLFYAIAILTSISLQMNLYDCFFSCDPDELLFVNYSK